MGGEIWLWQILVLDDTFSWLPIVVSGPTHVHHATGQIPPGAVPVGLDPYDHQQLDYAARIPVYAQIKESLPLHASQAGTWHMDVLECTRRALGSDQPSARRLIWA